MDKKIWFVLKYNDRDWEAQLIIKVKVKLDFDLVFKIRIIFRKKSNLFDINMYSWLCIYILLNDFFCIYI